MLWPMWDLECEQNIFLDCIFLSGKLQTVIEVNIIYFYISGFLSTCAGTFINICWFIAN